MTGAMLTLIEGGQDRVGGFVIAADVRQPGRAGASWAHALRGGHPGSACIGAATCGSTLVGAPVGALATAQGPPRERLWARWQRSQHVTLGHAAILAGTGHGARRAGAVVGHQLGSGRHGHASLAGAVRRLQRAATRCAMRQAPPLRSRCGDRCGSAGHAAVSMLARSTDRPRRWHRHPAGFRTSTPDEAGAGHSEHHLVGLDCRSGFRPSAVTASPGFFFHVQQAWLLPPTRRAAEP
jgi:hypothetical protein